MATDEERAERMTHDELVERALQWLASRRCAPIFNNCASCSEIPDAIGWSSSYKHRGSLVIECKASRSDFYADKKKRFRWKQPESETMLNWGRLSQKEAARMGLEREEVPVMGTYRYYLCAPGVITEEMLKEHADCHGLLYAEPRRIRVIKEAPRRENVNYEAEIRYLRFCIINSKRPYEKPGNYIVNSLDKCEGVKKRKKAKRG